MKSKAQIVLEKFNDFFGENVKDVISKTADFIEKRCLILAEKGFEEAYFELSEIYSKMECGYRTYRIYRKAIKELENRGYTCERINSSRTLTGMDYHKEVLCVHFRAPSCFDKLLTWLEGL